MAVLGQPADAQRPQPQRIAHAVDRVAGQDHQRVGALGLRHEAGQAAFPVGLAQPCARQRRGQHLGDHLAVAGGAQADAPLQQLLAQVQRVGQVAVVADAQRAMHGLDQIGLGVAQVAAAGGGVAVLADGQIALQRPQVVLVEHLMHQPHALVDVGRLAIAGGDACALLAAVLQGIQRKKGRARHVRAGRVDAEDAAGLARAVEVVVERMEKLGKWLHHWSVIESKARGNITTNMNNE